MAQVTQLWPTALPGRKRPAFVAKPAISYSAEGGIYLHESAKWSWAVGHYLEVTMRATSGTANARLYDLTAADIVADSALSTTSATFVRLRSTALTLTDGNEYRVQLGAGAGSGGEILTASLESF